MKIDNVLRTVKVATLATAVTAGSMLMVQAPAQAASTDCASGRLCLWDDTGYKDRRIDLTAKDGNLNSDDQKFGDKASSVYNHTSKTWKIYDDTSYGDRVVCLPPGKKISDLGADAYKFNDKASSAQPVSGC